jgi:phage terminase large subunit-like protein
MTNFTSDIDRAAAGYSPDRVDALVWAFTVNYMHQAFEQ